ncbi:DMT family transporter [Polaribacter dokdonensis]|uniref:EamA domain-containing membrane protein RarD n=1 Tax=Polaribacter dokdonensis DSW-5 TaxID=1300348 RepID=A0A0M9CFI1_9FLAO|nr:EamA family transporter [Polaribacter dokdonensis]KOY51482.1 putative transport protein [Polaribacter dokdonensis DSW-5]SEE10434.1 EamA domain-containing membrane protein RarD [Polaribacter dokdonensis DSW-5]
MNSQQQKWLYLLLLSFVWGSSFILMKKALIDLTPVQVGALRMLIAGVFLLAFGFKSLKQIKRKHYKYIVYTALLGTFFPVFLFAFAVNGIDSSIASILNSLTPFNTFIFGVLAFGLKFKKEQLLGIVIGLIGTIVLIVKGADLNPNQNYWFTLLVVIASIGYALNVNLVKKHLSDVSALSIVTGNFLLLVIPAFIVLYFSDFFETVEFTDAKTSALGYVAVLAIFGTGIAKVFYNKMVHLASPIFASSVTYLIPIVAVFWGILDGEELSVVQLMAGLIILLGVYLLNRSK